MEPESRLPFDHAVYCSLTSLPCLCPQCKIGRVSPSATVPRRQRRTFPDLAVSHACVCVFVRRRSISPSVRRFCLEYMPMCSLQPAFLLTAPAFVLAAGQPFDVRCNRQSPGRSLQVTRPCLRTRTHAPRPLSLRRSSSRFKVATSSSDHVARVCARVRCWCGMAAFGGDPGAVVVGRDTDSISVRTRACARGQTLVMGVKVPSKLLRVGPGVAGATETRILQ